jgi:hypothetical protein
MMQSEKEQREKYCKKRKIEQDNLIWDTNKNYNSGIMDNRMIERNDIVNACIYGRLDVVKKICEDESFVKKGNLIVWNAACCGRLNVVRFLLTIPFISENLDYKYILKEARAYGHHRVVTFLLMFLISKGKLNEVDISGAMYTVNNLVNGSLEFLDK